MRKGYLLEIYNHFDQLGIDFDQCLVIIKSLPDDRIKELIEIRDKKRIEKIISVYKQLIDIKDEFNEIPISENWIKFSEIMLSAKGISQAKIACSVAKNEAVLASGHAMELITAIANAEGEVQAYEASKVAQNKDVLASGHAVELVTAVANARTPKQAYEAREVAGDKAVLASGYAVEFVTIVANAEDADKAHETKRIIRNLIYRLEPQLLIKLAQLFANSFENSLSKLELEKLARNFIEHGINIFLDLSSDQNEVDNTMGKDNNDIKYDIENFWDVYPESQDELMSKLKEDDSIFDIDAKTLLLVKRRRKKEEK